MSSYATINDVQRIVNTAVDDLSGIIQLFAQNVDERFSMLESRADKTDEKIDRLTSTVDSLVKRLDDSEIDDTARDAQLARLERWIEQVAKKSGVKLQY